MPSSTVQPITEAAAPLSWLRVGALWDSRPVLSLFLSVPRRLPPACSRLLDLFLAETTTLVQSANCRHVNKNKTKKTENFVSKSCQSNFKWSCQRIIMINHSTFFLRPEAGLASRFIDEVLSMIDLAASSPTRSETSLGFEPGTSWSEI